MKQDGSWEQPALGIQRRLRSLGASLMTMEVEFKSGSIGALHQHPHEQQTFVLKGKFQFTIGDKIHLLETGDMVIIAGNVPHEALALEDGTLIDTFTPVRADLLD
jgi:quercetin dioxygenase-like cupin family protein